MKFSEEPERLDIFGIALAIMYIANPSLLISLLFAADIGTSSLHTIYESTKNASFKIAPHVAMNDAMM